VIGSFDPVHQMGCVTQTMQTVTQTGGATADPTNGYTMP